MAAREISVDAEVAAVLLELGGIFALKAQLALARVNTVASHSSQGGDALHR